MTYPPTQPERTALAEHRNGAATIVVAFILLRAAVVEGSVLGEVAAATALGISIVELGLSRRGYSRVGTRYPRAALASAAAVALVSVAGIVVTFR